MFSHNKRLQSTVRVSEFNPGLANLLLQQFGGSQAQMALRTASATDGNPVTGAELGMVAASTNSRAARALPAAKTRTKRKSAAPST